MKKSADWIAWCLQFVFGFIVGRLFVAFIGLSSGWLQLLAEEKQAQVCLGSGLVAAGLATRYGDRLWMNNAFKLIPPDKPQSNRLSRTMSLLTGLAGCGIILFAIFRK